MFELFYLVPLLIVCIATIVWDPKVVDLDKKHKDKEIKRWMERAKLGIPLPLNPSVGEALVRKRSPSIYDLCLSTATVGVIFVLIRLWIILNP